LATRTNPGNYCFDQFGDSVCGSSELVGSESKKRMGQVESGPPMETPWQMRDDFFNETIRLPQLSVRHLLAIDRESPKCIIAHVQAMDLMAASLKMLMRKFWLFLPPCDFSQVSHLSKILVLFVTTYHCYALHFPS
jgi:hypothetical protein